MKKVSYYLYQYLQTHLPPDKSSFHFTPLSHTFLSTLFYKINQAYIQWQQISIEIDNDWQNENRIDYEYIPLEIRKNWIENVQKETIIKRKCTLSIGEKMFHIYVWFPYINMTEKEIEYKIQNTFGKVYLWLSIVSSFLSKKMKCSKEVNIYLYLTHHSKFLPTNTKKKIDPLCANTAFTTGCIQERTNIHIFREEEWFKVFIHETFHTLGMDFIEMDHPTINAKILELFPISVTDIRLYEMYAELWAEIMNILFVVFLNDLPKKKGRLPLIKWISMTENLIETEMEFTIFQAKKILQFHKLKYTDLFIPEKAKVYQEETNIFSYYILKSIWIIHLNDFLEFCSKQPRGSSLKFYSSLHNLEKFIKKMKILAKSKFLLEKYTRNNVINKDANFANTTLRMSLYELD
jgi:hypothetical protein